MNVEQPDGLRVFPKAKNPLTSTLAGIFTVPFDEPAELRLLLKQIEHFPRR